MQINVEVQVYPGTWHTSNRSPPCVSRNKLHQNTGNSKYHANSLRKAKIQNHRDVPVDRNTATETQTSKLQGVARGLALQGIYNWIVHTWFLGRPDRRFWGGSAGPGGPENLPDRWAAKRPTGWKGFLVRRGRLDPKLDDFRSTHKPCAKKPSVVVVVTRQISGRNRPTDRHQQLGATK
jgi:hypothetical protein